MNRYLVFIRGGIAIDVFAACKRDAEGYVREAYCTRGTVVAVRV